MTETLVNTTTSSNQSAPSVAVDADGDFVVAWQSYGQEGSDYGVYAQRYDASGAAVGSEFRVNTITSNTQAAPSVAVDADGDFVVAWASSGQDGSSYGIYAQRYNVALSRAKDRMYMVHSITLDSLKNAKDMRRQALEHFRDPMPTEVARKAATEDLLER